MEYRSAQYIEDGRIDCEINHPRFGWVPCTACQHDEPTADLFADMVENGNVAPYVPPPAPPYEEMLAEWREKAQCDMLAFQDCLIDLGRFDDAEAAIAGADPKWRIRWDARGGVVVARNSAELASFAGAINLSEDDLDAMPIWTPSRPEEY